MMPVDYDLVIVGATPAGISAATQAAPLNVRVALVTQEAEDSALDVAVLMAASRSRQHADRAMQLGVWAASSQPVADFWRSVQQWAKAIRAIREAENSLAVLASLGVEIIEGCGEFYRKPTIGFRVNQRSLRSRAYLLAFGDRPVLPEIAGLATIDYLTTETLLERIDRLQAIKTLAIVGTSATAVELAQVFARLGTQVTLIGDRVLPHEDTEVARLIQAQLDVEGVHCLTQATVSQVRQIQGEKWLQINNQAIVADEILLIPEREPDVRSLNLKAARVQWNADGIVLNHHLQTTNSRIYACPKSGSELTQIVQIAVKNALFLPVLTMSDRSPTAIYTEPELARIGLTEAQAIKQYGKDVILLRHYFKTLRNAQIRADLIGLCKLIVRRNGEILGAHIVGSNASEIISPIALAMQQKLKIQALANLLLPASTNSEIIQKAAQDWSHRRLQQNSLLRSLTDYWHTL